MSPEHQKIIDRIHHSRRVVIESILELDFYTNYRNYINRGQNGVLSTFDYVPGVFPLEIAYERDGLEDNVPAQGVENALRQQFLQDKDTNYPFKPAVFTADAVVSETSVSGMPKNLASYIGKHVRVEFIPIPLIGSAMGLSVKYFDPANPEIPVSAAWAITKRSDGSGPSVPFVSLTHDRSVDGQHLDPSVSVKESNPYQGDLIRDFILSEFERIYNGNGQLKGSWVLAQWELLSKRTPKVIGYKSKDGISAVPYMDLEERLRSVFEQDRDLTAYRGTSSWQRFTLDNERELDNLPDNMRELWGKKIIAHVISYRLNSIGNIQRYVQEISYRNADLPYIRLAERWVLVNKNGENPLDGTQFVPMVPKETIEVNFGKQPLGLLVPANPKPIFSKN